MKQPYLIGVAGGSGSGKTTVVTELVQSVAPESVALIHHDAYYRDFSNLSVEDREKINFDHPDALETDLLVRHLQELADGRPVDVPVYDFTTHTRTGEVRRVEPTRVVIVDGILVLADPDLRRMLDMKVYVDADPDIRFIRRLERDLMERGRTLESVIRQYTTTVRPMHLEFVEPSKRYADIIVPVGGHNRVAVDMLVATLRELLTA
ncbi:MAG: uridine kinase [Gemmatimonadetes bacterium]|nr:MAG: uridine kinase [Gemmatimonadota bacterium]